MTTNQMVNLMGDITILMLDNEDTILGQEQMENLIKKHGCSKEEFYRCEQSVAYHLRREGKLA